MLFKKKKIDAKPKNERIYIKHAQQAAIKSNPMLAFKEWFDNLWAEDANLIYHQELIAPSKRTKRKTRRRTPAQGESKRQVR